MSIDKYHSGLLTTNARYCFFAESGKCFSSQVNGNMTVSAETHLRFRSHEKTTPTYIVSFLGDTEQKNFLYRKTILSASVWKWNSAMSTEKYQSGLFNDRCRVFFFQFNPSIIFGWCRWGNVRSASSGDSFYFRPGSVIFPGRHRLSFFLSVSVNNVFLPRWGGVFLAE